MSGEGVQRDHPTRMVIEDSEALIIEVNHVERQELFLQGIAVSETLVCCRALLLVY